MRVLRALRWPTAAILAVCVALLILRVLHPGIRARHLGDVDEATLSEDGTRLVWRGDSKLHTRDIRTGDECTMRRSWHEQVSPDGSLVALVSTRWDRDENQEYSRVTVLSADDCGDSPVAMKLDGDVDAVAFAADNERMAVGVTGTDTGDANRLAVYQRTEALLVFEREFPFPVETARFSPDGGLLAVGGAGALVAAVDARTGDLSWQLELFPVVAPAGVVSQGYGRWQVDQLRFSADGRYLAVGFDRDAVAIVDVEAGALVQLLESGDLMHIGALAFHPHEPQLAAGMLSGRVVLWDVETGEELERRNTEASLLKTMHPAAFTAVRLDRLTGDSWYSGVRAVGFSEDGDQLLAVAHDRLFSWPL